MAYPKKKKKGEIKSFPPGMKKKEVNIVRKKTPENLKMMKNFVCG